MSDLSVKFEAWKSLLPGSIGRIRTSFDWAVKNDPEIAAMLIYVTSVSEGLAKQMNQANRLQAAVPGILSSLESMKGQTAKQKASILGTAATGVSSQLGVYLSRKQAQDLYQYRTMPAIQLSGSMLGRAGGMASTYLSTRESIKKEGGDMGSQIGGMLGTGTSLALNAAAKPLMASGVGFLPGLAVQGLSALAGYFLASGGEKLGRKLGEKAMSGRAEKLATISMAPELLNMGPLLQFHQAYTDTWGSRDEYTGDGDAIIAMTDRAIESGQLRKFGYDRLKFTQLAGQIAKGTNIADGYLTNVTKRLARRIGVNGYDSAVMTNLYSTTSTMFYPGGEGQKQKDIDSTFKAVERFIFAAVGAKTPNEFGLSTALGLANLAQSLYMNSLGTAKNSDVTVASIHNFVRTSGVSRNDEAGDAQTETLVGVGDKILRDGITASSYGAKTLLQRMDINFMNAQKGMGHDPSLLWKMFDNISSLTGFTKDTASIGKDGTLNIKDRDAWRRTSIYLAEDPVQGLNIGSENLMTFMRAMTAYQQDPQAAKNSPQTVDKGSDAYKKEEARKSREKVIDLFADIDAKMSEGTDKITSLSKTFIKDYMSMMTATEEFFRSSGTTLAHQYAEGFNKLFTDAGSSYYYTVKESERRYVGGTGTDNGVLYGETYAQSDRVQTGSKGVEIYKSKLTPQFLAGIEKLAKRLKVDPNWLLAAMSLETGGTFSFTENTKGSKYHGLVQMNEKFIISQVGSMNNFRDLTPEQHFELVYQYFKSVGAIGRMTDVGDVYVAIAAPAYVGQHADVRIKQYTRATAEANPKWNKDGDYSISTGDLRGLMYSDPLSYVFLQQTQTTSSGQVQGNYRITASAPEAYNIVNSMATGKAGDIIKMGLFHRTNIRLNSPFGATDIGAHARGHEGLDYDGNFGDKVYAFGPGRVVYVRTDPRTSYGLAVVVRYKIKDSLVDAIYGHLQRISVRAGQDVTSSTVLGEVGSTGNSTGSHLHFHAVVVSQGISLDSEQNLNRFYNSMVLNKGDKSALAASFAAAMQLLAGQSMTALDNTSPAAKVKIKGFDEIMKDAATKFPNVEFVYKKVNGAYQIVALNKATKKGVTDATKAAISNYIKGQATGVSFGVSNKKTLYVQLKNNGGSNVQVARAVQSRVAQNGRI